MEKNVFFCVKEEKEGERKSIARKRRTRSVVVRSCCVGGG